MKRERYNNLIKAISVIYTILFCVSFVVFIILGIAQKISIFTIIVSLISNAIILILIWCLSNSMYRITLLEQTLLQKEIISQKDLDNKNE